MNKIWQILIFSGIFISFFTGKWNTLGDVIINCTKEAALIIMRLAFVIILWNGIFQIALDARLIEKICVILKRPLKFIFPELDESSEAYPYVTANLLANILGIGMAATPLGIKAMKKLRSSDVANRTMLTLVIVNCASLSIVPLTLISIRTSLGGDIPFKMVISYSLLSLASAIFSIIIDKISYEVDLKSQ